MHTLLKILIVSTAIATPALAARPVTQHEREKVEEALKALGCSGGDVEFDDDKFEVDGAACVDARLYDFDFDRQFRLIRMAPD